MQPGFLGCSAPTAIRGRAMALLCGAWLLIVLLALAGCARQPDDELVRTALQAELDGALGERVLTVESLRRAGSTRAPAAAGDSPTRLVYFNARLRLARDYDFARWESHSVGTLASLLGAGPKGIVGVKAGGNRAGDELIAYGTLGFQEREGRWAVIATDSRVARAPAGRPDPLLGPVPGAPRGRVDADPPSAVETALEQLRALAAAPVPTDLGDEARDRILVEEFERAHLAARQRLARAADELVLAGGPPGGAYAELADALARRARAARRPLAVHGSAGSADNVRLLASGTAQFAIVQNDVALAAYQGRGRFSGAPQKELRALASLFPEPLHLVVAARSGLRRVEDLRGKRVALGPEGSGTRINALAVLAAAGVAPEALAAIHSDALPQASAALAAGQVDAVFATTHAPSADLTRLALRVPLAWIAIPPSATPREFGLVEFTLPARSYPGQDAPVQTLAATALLVTRADIAETSAKLMLELLFDAEDAQRAGSAVLAQVQRRTARVGVTVPWLPVAEQALPAASAPAR